MLLGILAILASFYMVINTERGRYKPEVFQNGFMFAGGYSRSFVALWYFAGRSAEAKEAIVHDRRLRNKYMRV
jgi:hypothetical protein